MKLYTFQQEDVDKLRHVPARLVANEMGTGKTLEALALDKCAREIESAHSGKTLIVAPLTTLDGWAWHIEEFLGAKYSMVDVKNRGAFLRQQADFYLCHWEALRLLPELQKQYWLHVVADEVHKAKNRKAQQTQALKKIKAQFKTAMSGTPVVNAPHELWSILNWLYPTQYSSYWRFYKEHVDYTIIYPQGFHKITGPKNVEKLHRDIDRFYVRRRKVDVLKDLPNKYYTEVKIELCPEQRKPYEQMRKELIAWVGENKDKPLVAPVVIAQLVRLQQFAVASADIGQDGSVILAEPSSKLDALMQILNDNPDQQVVVFSQFKQTIKLLEQRLLKAGITYGILTGDVPQNERGPVVDKFQAGRLRVFMGTIAAGGVGITLHAASTVIFVDRAWSPALNMQAEDRLHRIGQKEAVQVIDLMATNTVDQGRKQTLNMKWEWIKQILGDET